jgi:hypothetical protein
MRNRSQMQKYGVHHFIVMPVKEEKITELMAGRG